MIGENEQFIYTLPTNEKVPELRSLVDWTLTPVMVARKSNNRELALEVSWMRQ
jgi:hypothetical protein